jgi:hypothetical protein
MKVGDLNSISPYINVSSVWKGNIDGVVSRRVEWFGDLTQNDVAIILGISVPGNTAPLGTMTLTLSKHGVGWIDNRDLKDVK